MNLIIFDIDGTLTNTKVIDDKCFMQTFESCFGHSIWNIKWENITNVTDWGIMEELFLNLEGRLPSKSEYDLMFSSFIANLNQELQRDTNQFGEIPGAHDFFNILKNDPHFEVGIATGSWEESAVIKLNAIGIDSRSVGFSNSSYFKSREDIIKNVIEQLNLKANQKPERIIYFGDGIWDYKTCVNLDVEFIGIDFVGDGKLSKLGAHLVFRDYLDYKGIWSYIRKDIP